MMHLICPLSHPLPTQIACGDSHNLALSAEGRVFAWGSGAYGRLGLGTEMDVQVRYRFSL